MTLAARQSLTWDCTRNWAIRNIVVSGARQDPCRGISACRDPFWTTEKREETLGARNLPGR